MGFFIFSFKKRCTETQKEQVRMSTQREDFLYISLLGVNFGGVREEESPLFFKLDF